MGPTVIGGDACMYIDIFREGIGDDLLLHALDACVSLL